MNRISMGRTVAVSLTSIVTAGALLLGVAGMANAAPSATVLAPGIADAVKVASPTQGLPSDWVVRGSGQFETSDPVDLLEYRVVENVVSSAVVGFRLESGKRCHWGKTLIMPDGQGSQWPIHIDPSRGTFSDEDYLWANQVHNGQSLELWKAGTFGIGYRVLDIGSLGALKPGSLVVFTWLKDSGSC
jgi:hypothetical protein